MKSITEKQIKEKILNEISKTEKQIKDYTELTKPIAPDDAIGRVSRMDAINNRSVNEASLKQAKDKLISLKHVLSQIGTKKFGLCLSCNEPIPIGRILFRPQSLLCVKCAR